MTRWNRIRLTAARVLARLTTATAPSRGVIFRGPFKLPGITLDMYEALRLSAVFACVSVISKNLAASTFEVFRRQANGNRDYLRDSRIFTILNMRPNPEMSAINFWQAMVAVMLLWGNSYAEIEVDAVGRPVYLWPLHPERCQLVRGYFLDGGGFEENLTGQLALRVDNIGSPVTFLPYARVYHIHGLGLDGTVGLNMVSVAARPILIQMATEAFRLAFYENGASIGGVLSTDQPTVGQEEMDALKAEIKERVAGVDNAFDFLVLGAGFKYQPLTPEFDKAKQIEISHLMIEETCRYWGIPPHVVQHLVHATFSNIEHLSIEFARSLIPWKRIEEQEIDYKLLPVGPTGVELDIEWIREGDSKTMAETQAILVVNGIATRNEIRRRRGMNAAGSEADVLTVQAQMSTLQRVIDGTAQLKQIGPPGQLANPDKAPGPNNAAERLAEAAVKKMLNFITSQLNGKQNMTPTAFASWVDITLAKQLRYAESAIENVKETLTEFGFSVESWRREVLTAMIQEDKTLLIAAHKTGNLRQWCNVEARAKDIAGKIEFKISRAD